MKTSIFDMTFVLPPLVEMTEVEKDIYEARGSFKCPGTYWAATAGC